MKKTLALLIAGSLLTAGCADKSSDITAAYVSPDTYSRYSCSQISEEARRVASRTSQLAGKQNANANRDAALTGAAIVLFWPAAFFVGGNKENAAELSRMKGMIEALEVASTRKRCGIEFRTAPATQ